MKSCTILVAFSAFNCTRDSCSGRPFQGWPMFDGGLWNWRWVDVCKTLWGVKALLFWFSVQNFHYVFVGAWPWLALLVTFPHWLQEVLAAARLQLFPSLKTTSQQKCVLSLSSLAIALGGCLSSAEEEAPTGTTAGNAAEQLIIQLWPVSFATFCFQLFPCVGTKIRTFNCHLLISSLWAPS